MLKAGIEVLKPYIGAMNTQWVVFFLIITLLLGIGMKIKGKPHIPAVCFTVLYLGLVYTSTVLSRMPGSGIKIALTPLWSYTQWMQGNDVFRDYIVLNTLMLLPIGISLSFVWENRKRIVAFGFACSCLIEFSQLISKRGLFEIDDIIHNTAGVILGIALYTAARRWKHEHFSHRR